MKNNLLFVFIGALSWLLASCGKNELTKPAEVEFSIELKTDGLPAYFELKEIFVILGEFELKGKRESATDYYFNKSFENGLYLIPGSPTLMDFDIPQGHYSEINVNLSIRDDEFPGLLLHFFYFTESGDTVALAYSIDEKRSFEVTGYNNSTGTTEVFLNGARKNFANITIDLQTLAATIDRQAIEILAIKLLNDNENPGTIPKLVINQLSNEALYFMFLEAITQHVQLTFES